MPRKDGTGQMSAGAMTGRGLGVCTGADAFERGRGRGFSCKCGYGRGYNRNAVKQTSSKSDIEVLQTQKTMLQSRLEAIDKKLENL